MVANGYRHDTCSLRVFSLSNRVWYDLATFGRNCKLFPYYWLMNRENTWFVNILVDYLQKLLGRIFRDGVHFMFFRGPSSLNRFSISSYISDSFVRLLSYLNTCR